MKTYARIVANCAVDVTTSDPATLHHPDVAAQFVQVPAGTQNGATLNGSTWTAPPVVVPAVVAPIRAPLSPMTFYLAFTPAERVAIKTSADVHVKEFWETYELASRLNVPVDPNLSSVQDGLMYLVSIGTLASAARVDEILSGVPK